MPPSESLANRGFVRLLAGACVTFGAALVAFPGSAHGTERIPPAGAIRYTGEAIFRGVAFGDGAVAQRLQSDKAKMISAAYAQMTVQQVMRVRVADDSAIARIKRADPSFFARYASKMQSGNPVLIDQAMNDGHKMLLRIFENEKRAIRVDDTQQGCLLVVLAVGIVVINVAAVLNFDIAANFVTAANIVTVANAVYQDTLAEELSPDNALYRDQAVRRVALRVAIAG